MESPPSPNTWNLPASILHKADMINSLHFTWKFENSSAAWRLKITSFRLFTPACFPIELFYFPFQCAILELETCSIISSFIDTTVNTNKHNFILKHTKPQNLHQHVNFIPKKFELSKLSICQQTILEQYWMYSTLPTLNNKKITAMFYVHFFSGGYVQWKKRERKTWTLYFWVTAPACVWSRCIEWEWAEHKTATSKIKLSVLRANVATTTATTLNISPKLAPMQSPKTMHSRHCRALDGGSSEKAEAR